MPAWTIDRSIESTQPSTHACAHTQVVEDSLKTLNQLLNKELAAGDERGAANFPISKAVQISVDAVTLARMTMGG